MASWPSPADRAFIGKPIKRTDGPDKARGTAKYAYDINRPGMLYGRTLGSPHARARIKSIDLSAAKQIAGVRAAIALFDTADPNGRSTVNYQGEEIAAVAAVSEEIAEDAVRLIKVDYEVLPHLATVEQAMRQEAPQAFPKGNVTEPSVRQEGDVDTALKSAAVSFSKES